ncbi:MAG: T9SS type A sorting domain-containing protein [Saprospiraceae bacterium]|nr:T9SS type A sorting domain-containing protein [Saprospiraceae bacterium]
MLNQSKLLFSVAFLMLFALTSQSQVPTPFWSEDFTNGFPAGWTTTDASGQNILWTWCPDPLLGNSNAGCSPIFNDGINLQEPFKATTSSTGFMTLDSDEPLALPQNHISRLTTSAIDCSGKDQVFITFQAHIGVYTVSAESGAVLRVSSDGTNWTEYVIFPGLTTGVRWSKNPEEIVVDISSVAAGKPTVYVQWQWTGNWEYFWNLDDVEIYDVNPTARFNISMTNFFYPASSYATPASQIATDTFGFFVTLSNKGLEPMTNIVVKAAVENTLTQQVLFEDSVVVAVLNPGVVDSAIDFSTLYAPELPIGEYLIRYEVYADSIDLRPDDNVGGSPFIVTDEYFAKEDEPQSYTRTAQDIAWNVGNYYLMGSGANDKYQATNAVFAFSTDPAELLLTDVKAAVYLFKVNDDIAPDFSNFELNSFPGNSLEWLGFADYSAPPTITPGQLQQVEIIDFDSGLPGVPLETGGRYFLMVGYPEEAKQTNHAFNRKIKYYNTISTVIYTSQWFLGGFGDDFSAVVRMYISLLSTTDDKPLPESAFKVFPNPASDVLNLDLNFDKPTDVTITIAELSGRVVNIEDRQGVTNEIRKFNLNGLAAGTYLARIATKEGSRTLKFIVQR